MNIGEFYKIIIKEAINHDPRGKKGVERYLKSVKAEYSRLSPAEKEAFDKERLTNPYSDTRIIFGSPEKELRTIMAGIDIETPELLLADRLKAKGARIDLVLSHHPAGPARVDLYRVMDVLYDILAQAGLSGAKIKKMLAERVNEVLRKALPGNHPRSVDAARLLNIPFACAHTAADNFAYHYICNLTEKKKPSKVSDIMESLCQIPEYKIAMKGYQGPKVILGKLSNKCGKILVEMTGGTEGPKGIYKELVKKHIKTLVCMHVSEEHFKKAKKQKDLNIIIAGHISSDTLGMNLLLDKAEKQKKLNIISCSGFTRIRR